MIKSPNPKREPPGLEWWLFKRLPKIALLGLSLFGLAWLAIRFWPWSGREDQVQSAAGQAEFALLGGFIFFITMLFTVLIGCIIVLVMKGPAYTSSDSFRVEDAESPR